MDSERLAICAFIVCFVTLVTCASGCQKAIEIEAIKAGLHQDVGSGRWVK